MAENNKTSTAESEEDVEALLESCEELLVTDDKPNKDSDAKEIGAQGALTDEERVQNEIKKSLEEFGALGAELGGDFAVDFQKEFAKILSEGDNSSEARAALEGLPDLMNALHMVAGEVGNTSEDGFLNSVSANFLSACSDIQANLPKFGVPQENGDNTTSSMQEEELDQLQNRMQSMLSMFSKDIFKPALKVMGEKYPKWLEENRPKLSDSEAHRYEQHYEIVKSILAHLDKEDVGNEQEHMMKFASLLEKMQGLGLPPEGLLDSDPLANFNSSAALEQCCLM